MDALASETDRTVALLNVVMAALFATMAYPLMRGMVPRNRYFGFRTTRSMASDEAWLAANALAGRCMMGWATAIALLNGIFLLTGLPLPAALAEQVVMASGPVGMLGAGLTAWALHQRA